MSAWTPNPGFPQWVYTERVCMVVNTTASGDTLWDLGLASYLLCASVFSPVRRG